MFKLTGKKILTFTLIKFPYLELCIELHSVLDSDSILSEASKQSSDIIIKHNFSIVHYNQSAVHKIDLLESEFTNFGAISNTETWFTPNITCPDININGFKYLFVRIVWMTGKVVLQSKK